MCMDDYKEVIGRAASGTKAESTSVAVAGSKRATVGGTTSYITQRTIKIWHKDVLISKNII